MTLKQKTKLNKINENWDLIEQEKVLGLSRHN